VKVLRDHRIDIWLTADQAAEIVELARADDRPVSATARKLVEIALAQLRAMRAPQPAMNGHYQQQPHHGAQG
jgi:hypothetical protein